MQSPSERPAPRLLRGWWVALALLALPCLCCGGVAGGVAILIARDQSGPPTDQAALRDELRTHLSAAQTAWDALDDLWGRLEAGQAALCSAENPPTVYFIAWRAVDLAAYPALALLVDDLNAGISAIHTARDAWIGVCQGGAVEIPPDIATSARAALDRAADRLADVRAAVATLPPAEDATDAP